MRWPWVSRQMLDQVMGERDRLLAHVERLEARIDGLVDQIVRIQRSTQGMSEVPREQKPMKPMPDEIRAIIMSAGDSRIRAMQIREAWHRYQNAGDWGAVMADMFRQEPPPLDYEADDDMLDEPAEEPAEAP